MKTSFTILVLSLLAIIAGTNCARSMLVGNYRPISNLKDPHVQEIGKYAVTKHNELDGTKLEYVNILKGESQVVAGTNYRLQISAKDGAAVHTYQAVVYERSWDNYMNLTSFDAL